MFYKYLVDRMGNADHILVITLETKHVPDRFTFLTRHSADRLNVHEHRFMRISLLSSLNCQIELNFFHTIRGNESHRSSKAQKGKIHP